MTRFAITFGEVAILHSGSKEIGKIRDKGFSVAELRKIKKKIKNSKLIMLSDILPDELRKENEACLLVIKNGIDLFLKEGSADKMLKEQKK